MEYQKITEPTTKQEDAVTIGMSIDEAQTLHTLLMGNVDTQVSALFEGLENDPLGCLPTPDRQKAYDALYDFWSALDDVNTELEEPDESDE